MYNANILMQKTMHNNAEPAVTKVYNKVSLNHMPESHNKNLHSTAGTGQHKMSPTVSCQCRHA